MARTPRDVTDAELAILQVLWEQGPANRRQITDVLYPGGGPSHYTTVQKLLERLESKGHVRRTAGEGRLTFAATVTREELISRRLLDVAEKLCGGSLTPLLMNLVQAKPLTPAEIAELRALIDEAGGQARPRRTPR
jgi:predicted transcriptional regulator